MVHDTGGAGGGGGGQGAAGGSGGRFADPQFTPEEKLIVWFVCIKA